MPKWLRYLFDFLNRLFNDQTPPEPSPNPSDIPDQLLSAHNKERASIGASELRIQHQLQSAAEKHARWMAENETMSHRGARGSTVGDRVLDEGYLAMSLGENIASGYDTVESVMKGWMGSRGHKSNILHLQYTDCGLAKAGQYWCVVFGSARSIRDQKYKLGLEKYEPIEFCPEPLENRHLDGSRE